MTIFGHEPFHLRKSTYIEELGKILTEYLFDSVFWWLVILVQVQTHAKNFYDCHVKVDKPLSVPYIHQHMSQTHISIRPKHTPAYVTNTLMCKCL
jgi:hypothetical protein